MTIQTSARVDALKPSVTLSITALAAELRASGRPVISFGAGEPDFETPAPIRKKAKQFIDQSVSKYTAVPGRPDVRTAFAAELSEVHGCTYATEDVLVSNGAKHSLFNAFAATLNPGDEFIVPAPYWVSYPALVELAGGTPVIVETKQDDGFMLSVEALKSAITPRTRGLLINSPSNPTGSVYTEDRLAKIGALCSEHDLFVISDDIYRKLVYGDAQWNSFLRAAPKMRDTTLVIDGVSKAYAMTGWRIGYAAGPSHVIKAMAKLQGQSTSNANHLAQLVAMSAVVGSQDCVETMKVSFTARRNLMVDRLNQIPHVSCSVPQGAFYAFPDLSHYLGKKSPDGKGIDTDVQLAEYLVEKAEVAWIPGSAFGAPGFARLSYACSEDDIKKGLERITKALGELA